MSFQGKYEILSTLSDGESKSFRARQISSGRLVVVHHIAAIRAPSQQPDLASLIYRFLHSASTEEMKNFLDMGEAQGCIYVVTADVPECQDLRQWLLSLTAAQAGKEGAAQPVAEEPGDLRMYELTSDFNTEVLRQILHSSLGGPLPPSLGSSAVTTDVASAGTSAGILVPPPRIPASSLKDTDHNAKEDSASGEKSNLAGSTASISAVPEVTRQLLTLRSFFPDRDAAAVAVTPPPAKPADREPSPAAVAGSKEAKGAAGPSGSSILTPPEVITPPPPPREAQAAEPSPQPTTPTAPEPQEVPGPPLVMGFEAVFQSDRARKHPTLSGAPDQSEVATFQAPIEQLRAPTVAVPTPAPAGPPAATLPAIPGAERREGRTPQGFPSPPGEPKQALRARAEPSKPAAPRRAWEDLPPSEKTVPLAPVPAPPPGEYTRMIENVRALAGPLAPAGSPPTPSPAASRQAAVPGAPPRLRPGSLPREGRPVPAHPPRKVWVPILILCSLFLSSLVLLLFFALKH